MLLQTNSYIVPRDKRMEHARLLRRFRQTLMRLGCDHFEVYEQVGANWNTGETTGRFVQIMRFRDRKHQLSVQGAERTDPVAQTLVREFCELINFPYQQQQGLFAVGFYTGFLRMPPQRTTTATEVDGGQGEMMEPPPQFVEQAGDSDQHPAGEPTMVEEAYTEETVNEGDDAIAGTIYAGVEEPVGNEMPGEGEVHAASAGSERVDPSAYVTDDSETEFSIVAEHETDVAAGLAPGEEQAADLTVPETLGEDAMTSDELRMAAEALFGPAEGENEDGQGENGEAENDSSASGRARQDHEGTARKG